MSGVRRAFVFAYADRILVIAVNLATLTITARLLTPREFGIAVLGMTTLVLIDAVRDFGTGAYLIQTDDPTEDRLRTVFTVIFLLTGCLGLGLWLLSGPIESLYGTPGLRDYLRVGAAAMLFSPFAAPLFALLRRELDFGALTTISAVTTVVGSIATVCLAGAGASHMSFAWAGLLSSALSLALGLYWRPRFSIYRPSLAAWQRVAAYGAFDSLRNVLYTLQDSVLFLVFGWLLGPVAVGLYHRAVTFSRLPERVILAGLGPVLLPAFSKRARDGRDLKESYMQGVEFVTVLLWPCLLVMMILAHPLVLGLLGRQWIDTVSLVQIMAAAYLMWFPMNLTNPVLIAAGAIRDTFVLALLTVPACIGLQIIAANYGLQAAALSMLVTVPLFVVASVVTVRRRMPFRIYELAYAMRKSIVVAVMTALGPFAAVFAAGTFEIGSLSLTTAGLGLAAAGWLAGLRLTGHPMLGELHKLASAATRAVPSSTWPSSKAIASGAGSPGIERPTTLSPSADAATGEATPRVVERSIDVTVILATHNGAGVLPRTLQGYRAIDPGDARWKLVVVDNGSNDATATILRDFMKHLPLHIVDEPRLGKNTALNRAIEHIEGDCVIFTDDDAVPQAGFLDAWRSTFKAHPEFAMFGGTVDLLFERPVADWHMRCEAHFDVLYALNRRADGPIAPELIFGPNMAVRAEALRNGLRFPENVGPNASDKGYPMGSETAFCLLMAQAGHKSWFASRPRVLHIVREHQITKVYIRARARRYGRGLAVRQWDSGALVPRVRRSALVFALGIALRKLKYARMFLKTLRLRPERRFEAVWQFEVHRGFEDEYEERRRAFRSGTRDRELAAPPSGPVPAVFHGRRSETR